jgi:hypothetical protein
MSFANAVCTLANLNPTIKLEEYKRKSNNLIPKFP